MPTQHDGTRGREVVSTWAGQAEVLRPKRVVFSRKEVIQCNLSVLAIEVALPDGSRRVAGIASQNTVVSVLFGKPPRITQ